MDIPLDVPVYCTDGRCGRSTFVVINPASEKITHIVVKESKKPRLERLVPLAWIADSSTDMILLNHPIEDFSKLDPFRPTNFVYTEIPAYSSDPKLTALWPYVVPTRQFVDEVVPRIAPGELPVRKGARVRATDGRVGRVDEFIVGPNSGHITHIVLREGHLWGHTEISVPTSCIDRIEENVVHLNVTKKEVEKLPKIAVKRSWR